MLPSRISFLLFVLFVLALFLSGCAQAPTPTVAPTLAPNTAVPTATSAPTQTLAPTPTATATLTPVPTQTATRAPTNTPAPTYTPSPTPTPAGPRSRLDGKNGLAVIDLASGSRTAWTSPAGSVLWSSAWSLDGKQVLLAWTLQREKESKQRNGVYTWLNCPYTGYCYYVDTRSEYSTKTIENYGGGLRLINDPTGVGKDVVSGGEADFFREAVWSPDGKKIALLYKSSDGNQCPFVVGTDGVGLKKLPNCEADDHPRFWSVDGKWIVTWSDRGLKLFAYEVDGERRVPLEQLGKIQLYDQAYWPWKVIESPACAAASFWDCG